MNCPKGEALAMNILASKINKLFTDESWRRTNPQQFLDLFESFNSEDSAIERIYNNLPEVLRSNLSKLDGVDLKFLANLDCSLRELGKEEDCDVIENPKNQLFTFDNRVDFFSKRFVFNDNSSCWIEFYLRDDLDVAILVDNSSLSFLRLRFNFMQPAKLNCGIFILQKGGTLRIGLDTNFTHPQSEGMVTILGYNCGNGHFDLRNCQSHVVPRCKSDTLLRLIAKDSSYSTFWGLIEIDNEAEDSDAYQLARAMLLSNNCRADLIPNLKIGANSVRCTHGASYSQISPMELFYLRSRGLRDKVARELLLEGFLREGIERLADRSLDFAENFLSSLVL